MRFYDCFITHCNNLKFVLENLQSTGSQSLEVGDTVLGRVVHSDIDGAKIELINSPSTSQG